MHPLVHRNEAVQLRKGGYSYSFISKKLHVSKSTLSGWLSGIKYIPNTYTVGTIGRARAASGAAKSALKRESLTLATSAACKEVGRMSRRDFLMLGIGLYAGEGSKSYDCVRFVNADPDVIALAMVWFRTLGVTDSQFAPRLHLYPDSNIQTCTQFWSRATGIPVSKFMKAYVDRRTNKSVRKSGKLLNGTLHLSILSSGKKEYGVFFFRKIMAMQAEVIRQGMRV